MKRSVRSRIVLLLLAAILILPHLSAARAENGEEPARDLTRHLALSQSAGHGNARTRLLDDNINDTEHYVPYETIRLTWENAKEAPAYLCIQWTEIPERVRIRQLNADGTMLSDVYADPVYDAIVPISEDAAAVTFVAGAAGMDLTRLALFSEGTLPAPFYNWLDTPKGMDYLIVSTHPDDDVLFMGGVIPIYGMERGYVGTVAYVTTPSRYRVNEANKCAWEMGARYRPIFLGLQDLREDYKNTHTERFLPDAVTLAFVRMLREYRPLVVFSHDVNGEYGHWQHKIVSAAIKDACRLCADPTFDVFSYEEFGTWEVQKCYLHMYPDDPLVMDIRTPLASMGGRNAFEVAEHAFKMHGSQQNGRHVVEGENGRYAMNRFGMAYGVVDAGNDVFDNIDPTLLSSYTPPPATPEPTPEPTEKPTPEPTEEPTAAPTPEPTAEPTQEPTPAPTAPPTVAPQPTAAPQTDAQTASSSWLAALMAFLAGAAMTALLFMLLFLRKRR
ncbi:MAG: PIG-L family deacetylase [Clostridia bacterium]|nr:PIG-L family deacetylase [Clostridia bacterium]